MDVCDGDRSAAMMPHSAGVSMSFDARPRWQAAAHRDSRTRAQCRPHKAVRIAEQISGLELAGVLTGTIAGPGGQHTCLAGAIGRVLGPGSSCALTHPHRSIIPATTHSPTGKPGSTIGAGRLNCCVRNGNRWNPPAVVTGMRLRWRLTRWRWCRRTHGPRMWARRRRGRHGFRELVGPGSPGSFTGNLEIEVKPHGHLVRVS